MTEEDYLAWRENPVTQWVMEAYRISADLCESQWKDGSWTSGVADQSALTTLRDKAIAFRSIFEADFEDIAARHDSEGT